MECTPWLSQQRMGHNRTDSCWTILVTQVYLLCHCRRRPSRRPPSLRRPYRRRPYRRLPCRRGSPCHRLAIIVLVIAVAVTSVVIVIAFVIVVVVTFVIVDVIYHGF